MVWLNVKEGTVTGLQPHWIGEHFVVLERGLLAVYRVAENPIAAIQLARDSSVDEDIFLQDCEGLVFRLIFGQHQPFLELSSGSNMVVATRSLLLIGQSLDSKERWIHHLVNTIEALGSSSSSGSGGKKLVFEGVLTKSPISAKKSSSSTASHTPNVSSISVAEYKPIRKLSNGGHTTIRGAHYFVGPQGTCSSPERVETVINLHEGWEPIGASFGSSWNKRFFRLYSDGSLEYSHTQCIGCISLNESLVMLDEITKSADPEPIHAFTVAGEVAEIPAFSFESSGSFSSFPRKMSSLLGSSSSKDTRKTLIGESTITLGSSDENKRNDCAKEIQHYSIWYWTERHKFTNLRKRVITKGWMWIKGPFQALSPWIERFVVFLTSRELYIYSDATGAELIKIIDLTSISSSPDTIRKISDPAPEGSPQKAVIELITTDRIWQLAPRGQDEESLQLDLDHWLEQLLKKDQHFREFHKADFPELLLLPTKMSDNSPQSRQSSKEGNDSNGITATNQVETDSVSELSSSSSSSGNDDDDNEIDDAMENKSTGEQSFIEFDQLSSEEGGDLAPLLEAGEDAIDKNVILGQGQGPGPGPGKASLHSRCRSRSLSMEHMRDVLRKEETESDVSPSTDREASLENIPDPGHSRRRSALRKSFSDNREQREPQILVESETSAGHRSLSTTNSKAPFDVFFNSGPQNRNGSSSVSHHFHHHQLLQLQSEEALNQGGLEERTIWQRMSGNVQPSCLSKSPLSAQILAASSTPATPEKKVIKISLSQGEGGKLEDSLSSDLDSMPHHRRATSGGNTRYSGAYTPKQKSPSGTKLSASMIGDEIKNNSRRFSLRGSTLLRSSLLGKDSSSGSASRDPPKIAHRRFSIGSASPSAFFSAIRGFAIPHRGERRPSSSTTSHIDNDEDNADFAKGNEKASFTSEKGFFGGGGSDMQLPIEEQDEISSDDILKIDESLNIQKKADLSKPFEAPGLQEHSIAEINSSFAASASASSTKAGKTRKDELRERQEKHLSEGETGAATSSKVMRREENGDSI